MKIVTLFHRIVVCVFLLPAAAATVNAITIDPDTAYTKGLFSSMAIVEGRPAVVYTVTAGAASVGIRYCRSSDTNGDSWGSPVTVVNGGGLKNLALLTGAGNPAVVYWDGTAGTLKFTRAADATGLAWNPPVSINTAPNRAQDFDARIVDGKPAICYAFGNDLLYRRAADENGMVWGAAVVADFNPHNSEPSLEIVDGRPAVAYMSDSLLRTLRYVRALDAAGAAWGGPVDVATPVVNLLDASPSLKVVNGRPAIAYIRTKGLKYVRANDSGGSVWGTPVDALAPLPADEYCSLAVVKGKPAIAAYSGSGTGPSRADLVFRMAGDAGGDTLEAWEQGETDLVSTTGDTGRSPTLLEVNGNAAVSWYDFTRNTLEYKRATETNEGQRFLWDPVLKLVSPLATNPIERGGSVVHGPVKVGTTSDISFTAENFNSGVPLSNVAVTIDGPDVAEFSIVQAPPSSFAPHDVKTFAIRYAPVTAGRDQITVHFHSSAEGIQSEFSFTLIDDSAPSFYVEAGSEGKFYLDGTQVFLPVTAAGQVRDIPFWIFNKGGGDLHISGITFDGPDRGEFSIPVPPPSIQAPATYAQFIVRHAPLTDGYKTAQIHIASDAIGDENPYDITFRTAPAQRDFDFNPYHALGDFSPKHIAVRLNGTILALTNELVALNENNERDFFFFSPALNGGSIQCFALQKDGRILAGGDFDRIGGLPGGLGRLLPDGSPDTTFHSSAGAGVSCIAIQPDGRVLAGGNFSTNGGEVKPALIRMAADGSLDTTFQAKPLGTVRSLALLPDGKILAGARVDTGAGPSGNISRLRSNGTFDNFQFEAPGEVTALAVQADGKFYAHGFFNGPPLRILPDGTSDPSIATNESNSRINGIALQTDGKCIMTGNFIQPAGVTRPGLARLLADGSLDEFFDARFDAGILFPSSFVTLQGDGSLLVIAHGLLDQGFIRLFNDPAPSLLTASDQTTVRWMRGGSAVEVYDVSFDLQVPGSSDWTALGSAHRISGGWELSGLSLPPAGLLRVQAYTHGGSVVEVTAPLSFALQAWRQEFFGTAGNSGDAADSADPDSDGLTNLVEYAFGLSPVDRASNALPEFTRTGTSFTAAFTTPQEREDVVYGVERSPTMQPGTWTAVPDTGTGGNHTFSVTATGDRVFLRFKIEAR